MNDQDVATVVERIKAEIIPTFGMEAFREDPGGMLSYFGFTESDEVCAAAIQRVLEEKIIDPNFVLFHIRELTAQLRDIEQIDSAEHAQQVADDLAEFVQALDQSLSSGGDLPADWQMPR